VCNAALLTTASRLTSPTVVISCFMKAGAYPKLGIGLGQIMFYRAHDNSSNSMVSPDTSEDQLKSCGVVRLELSAAVVEPQTTVHEQ
jgi:hypothetical protein